MRSTFLIIVMLISSLNFCIAAEGDALRVIIPAVSSGRAVDASMMQQIYNEVKTPYKYGVILKADSIGDLVDCANIFRFKGHWYMVYVSSSKKIGYQTYLAQSDDLLNWEKLGKILSFTQPGEWDAWQADASIALCDYRWGGKCELEKFDGKYWLSYIGGGLQGYETDPLSICMAWTNNLPISPGL